jgi:hypothetical protein
MLYKKIKTHFNLLTGILVLLFTLNVNGQPLDLVPIDQRGSEDFVRQGTHDANRIRTMFYNYGMVGDYPSDPANVDYTIFHSVEWPKGILECYSDGVTPFVLAKLQETVRGQLQDFYIMETGYRERQEVNPTTDPKRGGRLQRFNPRQGIFSLIRI